MKRRLISAILVMAMLCTFALPVFAALDETMQPRFSYTNSIFAKIEFNKLLGIAKCTGNVVAKSMVPIKTIVRLQQETDTGWVTLATWENTGEATCACYGEYAVYRGYTYRVTVTGYVYDVDGVLKEVTSASHSDYLPGLFG